MEEEDVCTMGKKWQECFSHQNLSHLSNFETVLSVSLRSGTLVNFIHLPLLILNFGLLAGKLFMTNETQFSQMLT